MENDSPIMVEADPQTEAFLSASYRRIQSSILVIAAGLVGPVFYFFGWRIGGGFLLGAVISYVNFLWLKQSIIALTDSINEHSPPTGGRPVAFKFIFRFAVIAAVAYAIIFSSSPSIAGLIGGLFLSVVALLFEAVTEVVHGLRHGQ